MNILRKKEEWRGGMNSRNMRSLLKEISNKYGLTDFLLDINQIEDSIILSIGVIGEFSSGKSTLLNALIGKNILPTFTKPTTSSIVEIVGSDCTELKAEIVKENVSTEIEIDELGGYINGERSRDIDKVVIRAPENDFIKKGFLFVDTPGVNSIKELHDSITFNYIPNFDAVIVLLDINKGSTTKSLLSFLKNKVIKQQLDNFIFALNYSDTKNKNEAKRIENDIKKELKEIIENPTMITISAKKASEAGIKGSGVDTLKDLLREEIIGGKEELFKKRLAKELNKKAMELISLLEEKNKVMELDTESFEKKISETKQEIDNYQKEIDNIKAQFENTKENIMSNIKIIINKNVDVIIDQLLDDNSDKARETLENISNEIIKMVNNEFDSFNGNLEMQSNEFLDSFHARISDSLRDVKEWGDIISYVINTLLLAALFGPKGITGKELPGDALIGGLSKIQGEEKEDGKKKKEGTTIKDIFRMGIALLHRLDVVTKGVNVLIKEGKKNEIKDKMNEEINDSLSGFWKEANDKLMDEISEIEQQLNNYKSILELTRNEREQKIKDFINIKNGIKQDIISIRSVM